MSPDIAEHRLIQHHDLDPAGWTLLERIAGCQIFLVSPTVHVLVPDWEAHDTVESAREIQQVVWRDADARGQRQARVVLLGPRNRQDAGARRIWACEADAQRTYCTALLCASPMARAIAGFAMGLRRQGRPMRMFGRWRAALSWCEVLGRDLGGPISRLADGVPLPERPAGPPRGSR